MPNTNTSSNSSASLLAEYSTACNYPGRLDEREVEAHLMQYLQALGIERKIERLRQGWILRDHPSLQRYTNLVLDDFSKRTGRKSTARAALDARDALDARSALDARAARDALDARSALDAQAARAALDALDARSALDARAARDALDARAARDAQAARDALDALDARDALAIDRFAKWCVQSYGWGWWRLEISWLATTYLGAIQRKDAKVESWSKPVYGAFLAGCWLLHFTDDTLYWTAKPSVHTEIVNGQKRLHNENYAAIESDVENLYFWHGVLVPAFVVVRPDWITAKHIATEDNAEVRRVMLERMGTERFAKEADVIVIHEDTMDTLLPTTEEVEPGKRLLVGYDRKKEIARLLRAKSVNDGSGRPLMFVHVVCPSTGREYYLRTKHDATRAYEAVAHSFAMTEEQYKKAAYLRQGDVMLKPLGKINGLKQAHS